MQPHAARQRTSVLSVARLVQANMKFILILCLSLLVQRDVLKHAMLAKTKRPYDPAELPAASRFRRNCQDMYADNLVSSSRLQELLDDAHDAGIPGLRDIRSNASSSHSKKNAHARLRRKFLKKINGLIFIGLGYGRSTSRRVTSITSGCHSCCHTSFWRCCID